MSQPTESPAPDRYGELHPFFRAAVEGDTGAIRHYLAEGNGVNVTSLARGESYGMTLLHLAVEAGQQDVVRLLLAAGADVNAEQFPNGETPLFGAVFENDAAMMRLLLDAGAHVDVFNYNEETPLHAATYDAFPEGVRILLEAGASHHFRTRQESGTPLYLCAYYWFQSVGCARLLLKAGADVNACDDDGYTPLDYLDEDSELYTLLRSYGGKTKAELALESTATALFPS